MSNDGFNQKCPNCGTTYQVTPALYGRRVKCAKCGQTFQFSTIHPFEDETIGATQSRPNRTVKSKNTRQLMVIVTIVWLIMSIMFAAIGFVIPTFNKSILPRMQLDDGVLPYIIIFQIAGTMGIFLYWLKEGRRPDWFGGVKKGWAAASLKKNSMAKTLMLWATVSLIPLMLLLFILGFSNAYSTARNLGGESWQLPNYHIIDDTNMRELAINRGLIDAVAILPLYFLVIAILWVVWFANRPD